MVKDNLFWKALKFLLFRIDSLKRSIKIALAKIESGGRPVIREIQGSKMYLDPSDRGISCELLYDNVREESSTNEFRSRLKKGMVVADIGANIGYYALMEAKHIGPEGKVFAFEPVPENINALEQNIKLNGYKNVEICPVAIGSETGKVSFFLAQTSNQGALVSLPENDFKGKITVDITTLDNFMQNKPVLDVVRMDVQGAEIDVLKGMKRILQQEKLFLFIEVHGSQIGKKKIIELLTILHQNGFENARIVKELPMRFKRVAKIVPPELLPLQQKFYDAKIEDLIKNPQKGWYHLFTEKGL